MSAANNTIAVAPYVPLPNNLYYGQSKMVLQNQEQWGKFHAQANEMLLLKKGRELFPKLDIQFVNLEKEVLYSVSVKLYRLSGHKHEYKNGKWQEKKEKVEGDWYTNEVAFVPMLGKELMEGAMRKQVGNLKIFNIGERGAARGMTVDEQKLNQILVDSQCKYIPVVTLKKLNEDTMWFEFCEEACFEETQFVTVTGYKNPKIKELKTSENKYRATNHPSCKRKHPSSPEGTDATTPSPPALEQLDDPEEGRYDEDVDRAEEEEDFFDFFPDLKM